MKKILILLICLLTARLCFADAVSNPPLNVEEQDGSPSTFPYKLKVTNGTLTDNGDGTSSLTTGGGGGTPGGADTQVQFNDNGSFGGSGQFTFDKTTNIVTASIVNISNTVTTSVVSLEGGTFDTYFTAGAPTASVYYNLPSADGTNGQFLSTNGSGALSWATSSGAGDITDVGDCANGACFTGSSGNTLTFKGGTSGTIGLKPTAIAGVNTITLPAETGTACTTASVCSGYQASGTYVTNVTGTSPIASSGGTTPAISIANAAADGSTKGAASFTANDFDASLGNISIDYTNGQAAAAGAKGFLTSADWTTFNNKQSALVNSAGLAAALSDETGTGNAVFSASPTFTGTIQAASINASGTVTGSIADIQYLEYSSGGAVTVRDNIRVNPSGDVVPFTITRGTDASPAANLIEVYKNDGTTLLSAMAFDGRWRLAIPSASPTIVAGLGAGTAPSVSLTGTDSSGEISCTTGTSPSANSAIVTIAFNRAFTNAPSVVFSASNSNAALLSGTTSIYATSSIVEFVLDSGSAGLTASTAYKWFYHALGQ